MQQLMNSKQPSTVRECQTIDKTAWFCLPIKSANKTFTCHAKSGTLSANKIGLR